MQTSSTRRRSLNLHCRQTVPATPVNSPNSIVGLKHIGQCIDRREHRNCIYNVIDELTETHDFEAMKRKLAKYKERIDAFRSQVRSLKQENRELESQGTTKSLRTMAGVIHTLNEKLKLSLQSGQVAETNFEHRIQSMQLSHFALQSLNLL